MSRQRTGYVVALVVAVVVLVGSVVAVAWSASPTSSADRQVNRGYSDSRGGDYGDSRRGGGPGMMDGSGMGWSWDDDGTSTLTLDQARSDAQTWVDEHLTGATLDDGVAVMRGYRFTATLDGTQAAVVVVREDGTVIGHLVSAATPSPTS
ncbi:MAG: hypothetical protein L6367_15850 [Cellulomonas sp.]|nr:hypothetical protein [Cellulomonas sp.]